MTDAQKAVKLRKAMQLLKSAGQLVLEALGDTDAADETRDLIDSAIDDLAADVMELEDQVPVTQAAADTDKPYVILEGLAAGNRFFTTNSANPTLLVDGTVACRVLGYADTIAQAQIFLYGRSYTDRTD